MLPRITLTIREACEVSGIGPTKLYAALKDKELQRIKVGRRTLIRVDELKAWLDGKAA